MARVDDILKKYGFERNAQTTWTVQGNQVIYHHILEAIALDLQIKWLPPQVLHAERDSAAILCMAEMDGQLQWSIGEATVGVNYKVSGKQAAYVWAMAEKRAKDRVIYKFLGLAEQFDDSAAEEGRVRDPMKLTWDHPDYQGPGDKPQSEWDIMDKFWVNIHRKASANEFHAWHGSEPVKLAIGKLTEDQKKAAGAWASAHLKTLPQAPAEGATSRADDGIWSDMLNKAKVALAKAKNEQEVNSYETMLKDNEFADATADVLEAFAKLCEGRRYELRTR